MKALENCKLIRTIDVKLMKIGMKKNLVSIKMLNIFQKKLRVKNRTMLYLRHQHTYNSFKLSSKLAKKLYKYFSNFSIENEDIFQNFTSTQFTQGETKNEQTLD